MRHVVLFSGGEGSFWAAKRVAAEHGIENLILLFTDVKREHPDTYRFLREAAANVGGELVTIADGRTPWELFRDERFIGNMRVDKCSEHLKRNLTRRWVEDHFASDEAVFYLGIDWTESHRYERARAKWEPYVLKAPLCEPPYQLKPQRLDAMETQEGIRRPALYDYGFQHNNCFGGCVKGGQAQWALLLRTFPDEYRYHEEQEQSLRELIGKNVSILKDRRGRTTKPMTLRTFREQIEAQMTFDESDWGGCGCMVDEEDA